MSVRRLPSWVAAVALVVIGAACDSGSSSASGCTGPTLAATWYATREEASAQLGTTYYGDPARSREVIPGAQAGEPAFSPDGRRIALAVGHGTGDGMAFSVAVVDVATGRQRVIARPASNSVAPAWSPDGRRLAYLGGVWPEHQVHVVGADGRDDHVVASIRDEHRTLLSPAWAPGGHDVYFLDADTSGSYGGTAVWSVSAVGGARRRVAKVPASTSRMAADPSGRTIVLSAGSEGPNHLLDVDTAALRRLRGAAVMQGTWASDDTIVGYDARQRLARFRLDGSRLHRIGVVPGFHTGTIRWWYGVSVRHCGT